MIKSTKIARSVTGKKLNSRENWLRMQRSTGRISIKIVRTEEYEQPIWHWLDDSVPVLGLADKLLLSKNWKLEDRSWETKKKELKVDYPDFFVVI